MHTRPVRVLVALLALAGAGWVVSGGPSAAAPPDRAAPSVHWDVPTPLTDGSYLLRGTIVGERPGTVTLATSGMVGVDGNCRLPTSGPVAYRMWVSDRPQTLTLTDAAGNATTSTFDLPPRAIGGAIPVQ